MHDEQDDRLVACNDYDRKLAIFSNVNAGCASASMRLKARQKSLHGCLSML
jgi:hypothetical protein